MYENPMATIIVVGSFECFHRGIRKTSAQQPLDCKYCIRCFSKCNKEREKPKDTEIGKEEINHPFPQVS